MCYTWVMMKAITIDRNTGDGKYGDVLDAAEVLSGDYGSAANALVQMARDSSLYADAKQKARDLDAEGKKGEGQ